MQVLWEVQEPRSQQELLLQAEPFSKAVSQHLFMVLDNPNACTFKFHFPKHTSLDTFLLQLVIGAQCVLGSSILIKCCTDYQSFMYSPVFLEYKFIIDDLLNAKDDQDVEDSEGKVRSEGDESKEP